MQLSDYRHIVYGTSKRSDGNMSFLYGTVGATIFNRERFLKRYDIEPTTCYAMHVEHAFKIVEVTPTTYGSGIGKECAGITADAFITSQKNCFLWLMTADCLPVVYYDIATESLALLHLGWQPCAMGLAQKTLQVMSEKYGTDPKQLIVAIGPSIKKKSYLHHNLQFATVGNYNKFIQQESDGLFSVDLHGYVKTELINNGVHSNNITISNVDTFTSKQYFSHRRESTKKEIKGRFATVVGMV